MLPQLRSRWLRKVVLFGSISKSAGHGAAAAEPGGRRAIQREDVVESQPVDGAEGVGPVNRRHRALVLDVRQAAQCDGEFGVSELPRDLLAGFLYLAIRQLQSLASPLEPQPRTLHGMILAVRLAVAPGVWKIDMIRNRHYIPPRRY